MLKPIRNNILVKPFLSDGISKGGIIVPDSYRELSNKVLIVKTGNGTKEKKMRLKEGQIGFRVKSWGCEVNIKGELYFLMEDSAIIALENQI